MKWPSAEERIAAEIGVYAATAQVVPNNETGGGGGDGLLVPLHLGR